MRKASTKRERDKYQFKWNAALREKEFHFPFPDKPYKHLQTLNNISNFNNNEKITPKIYNSTFVLVGGYLSNFALLVNEI